MHTSHCITILLAFIIEPALGVCLAGDSGGTGPAAVSRHVAGVVRVTADADVMPLDASLLESMLRSDAVAGEAARAALNAKYDEVFDAIHVQSIHADPGGAEASIASNAEIAFLSFSIDLPDRVKPAAALFAGAIIENMKRELNRAFDIHREWLQDGLKHAWEQQDAAIAALSSSIKDAAPREPAGIQPDPADETVYRQLETLVDLSGLKEEQPFSEAVEMLQRSVEPPLQIVVLWRELADNAQIEPGTPINIAGLTTVQLRAGLRTILEGMSNPQLGINLGYTVSDGVVTIATQESLPRRKMETRVHELPVLLRAGDRARGLEPLIQATVEPESWLSLSETGEGTIVACGDAKLVVRQTPEVHRKIDDLLRTMAAGFPVALSPEAPRESLERQMEFLLTCRSTLEQEMDKLQDRQRALAQKKKDPEKDTMGSSLRSIHDLLPRVVGLLEGVRTNLSASGQKTSDVLNLKDAIEMIKSCEALSRQATEQNRRLDDPAWVTEAFGETQAAGEEQTSSRRLAAKESELEQVSHEIMRIHDALVGRIAVDPDVHRLQCAAGRLQEADARVQRLEREIAELHPCSVSLLPAVR